MPVFSQDAFNHCERMREVFGWDMYDFAKYGYTTVVTPAVFAAYFVGDIANSVLFLAGLLLLIHINVKRVREAALRQPAWRCTWPFHLTV